MNTHAATAKTIFLDAIEIDRPHERDRYVDERCRSDPRLRAEVEALLRHHAGLGDYLEHPAFDFRATDDPPPVPAADEAAGTVIGPYRLLEAIGEGGMGVVYMAEQTVPVRRKVALKIIKPGMDTRLVVARFEAERQALALMDHPNIARVLDAGATESGRPYFVMELVHGIPITDYCDKARLSIHERLDLFVLTCRAVQHAHQKGVIHRDLKPSNVMVTLIDGVPVPKVIDFGVAKATGGRLTDKSLFTGFTQIVGTPLYMSPEQAELSGVEVDTRSDIYSLGVLLYELLTGTTPIDRDTIGKAPYDEIRRIIREQEPPTPSTRLGTLGAGLWAVSNNRRADARKLGHAVHGELDWIVMKALEKERGRRYETANDFAADVIRHLADEPVEACPPSASYRFAKYVRRHRTMIITMGLVAVALTAGTVVSTWQAFRATMAERRTAAALAVAERNERINRQYWYGSRIRLTQQELSVGQVEFAQEALERLRPRPGETDLRGFEWNYLRRLAHRDVSLLFGHESPVYALALAPDGRTLVSGDEYGTLVFWDLVAWRERARVRCHSGGERAGLRGNTSGTSTVVFSPDGRVVVSASSGHEPSEVKVWDSATAREVATLPGITGSVNGVAFSHDGGTLAVYTRDTGSVLLEGRVRLWNLSAGRTHAPAELPSIASLHLAVSPDRRLLATAALSGEVTLRDASTGRAIRMLTGPWSYVKGIGFTPDGHSLLVQNQSGLTCFDPATGAERGRIDSAPGGGLEMCFDVNLFKGLPLRRGGDFWLTDTRSDLRPTTLEGVSGDHPRFLFSPDGRTLSGGGRSQRATLWDVSSGKKRVEYSRPVNEVNSLAFTPRGDSLFFGAGDGKVRLWHFEKRPEPLDHLSGHDKEVWALAYTPDGGTLVSAADDHTIKLWDPRGGTLRGTLTGHDSLVTSLAVSPDGSTLASGGFDKTVRLWDLPSGRPRAVMSGHTDRVRGVAFSPDGRLLASGSSDFTIHLWDAAEGRERAVLRGHADGLHDLAFDHDGTRLISAGNEGALIVWDVRGGRNLQTIPCPKACTALVVSHDGSLSASGSDRGDVTVWDTSTWTNRVALKGSDAGIRKLAFSPDGRTLAAACDDAKVRLWDPITGQLTLVLEGHRLRVNAVAFSPDGSTLSSASHDGAIKLWHAGHQSEN